MNCQSKICVANALALNGAREALAPIKKAFDVAIDGGDPADFITLHHLRMAKDALSRTADPTVLLEAHDREREAEVLANAGDCDGCGGSLVEEAYCWTCKSVEG